MKKIIGLIIICTLLITSTFASFANSADIGDSNNLNTIVDGYREAGFEVTLLEQERNKETYAMSLSHEGQETISTVIAKENHNGDVQLTCIENGKTDVVLLKQNGEVYANGSKVIVEETVNDGTSRAIDGPQVEPKGRHYNVWVNNCPYGVAKDYSKQVGTPIKKVLTFEQAIKDFTIAALAGIIIGIMISSVVAGGLISAAAGAIINYFRNNSPKARAMSCQRVQYIHAKKGEIIEGEHIRKNIVTYYADKSYDIQVSKSTVYNKIKT